MIYFDACVTKRHNYNHTVFFLSFYLGFFHVPLNCAFNFKLEDFSSPQEKEDFILRKKN